MIVPRHRRAVAPPCDLGQQRAAAKRAGSPAPGAPQTLAGDNADGLLANCRARAFSVRADGRGVVHNAWDFPILGVAQKSGGRDLHRSSPSESERAVSRAAGYRSHTKQRRASDGRIEDGAPIGAQIRSAVAGVAGGSSLRTSRHSLHDGAVRGAGVRWRSEQFAAASALWPAGIVRRGSGRVEWLVRGLTVLVSGLLEVTAQPLGRRLLLSCLQRSLTRLAPGASGPDVERRLAACALSARSGAALRRRSNARVEAGLRKGPGCSRRRGGVGSAGIFSGCLPVGLGLENWALRGVLPTGARSARRLRRPRGMR